MDGPMMDTSQSHKLLKVRQQQVYRDSFTRMLGFFLFLRCSPSRHHLLSHQHLS